MPKPSERKLQIDRCGIFLVAVVLLLFVLPYFHNLRDSSLFGLFVFIVLLAGVYASSQKRLYLVVTSILGAPFVVFKLVQIIRGSPSPLLEAFALGSLLPFFIFVTFSMLTYVLRRGPVTRDKIFAAVSVYLLLAVTWAVAYFIIAQHVEHAFSMPSSEIKLVDTIYFSVVTLTTLGYGEITPSLAITKSLAMLEALTGVMFIAVMIARLVGAYRAEPGSD